MDERVERMVRKVCALNAPKSLNRGSSFVLGLVIMLGFLSGGFVTFLVALSEGQLMGPWFFFLLVTIPFGFVFAVFAYKLRQKIREKTRWASFSAFTLCVDMALVLLLFMLYMDYVRFWEVSDGCRQPPSEYYARQMHCSTFY